MKILSLFFLFSVLFYQTGHTQTFALNVPKEETKNITYTPDNFRQHRVRKKISATSIVGISSLSVGGAMVLGGLALEIEAGAKSERSALPAGTAEAQCDRDRKTAETVLGAGIVLGVSGIVLMVAGLTHDKLERMHHLSFTARKANEIGLAYHF
jgi:hypothetical protein